MVPGTPPETAQGTATIASVLDGRFLKVEFHGTMMGKPCTAIRFDGYDRHRGLYTSTWLDNMVTALMCLNGSSMDDGRTIEYVGEVSDRMASGKTVKTRTVASCPSDDAMSYAIYQTRDGKESKVLELSFARQKGSRK